MTRRPCCRERRTAGAPDFTETALIPAYALEGFDDDTPTAGVSGDQLDALPPGALERTLDRLAGRVLAGHEAANWRPVPRRPWRRVRCWALGGHFWFPDVPACLDCGKRRQRAAVRGDR